MVLVARDLAAQAGIAESGYRLVMNVNRGGGQVVFHIHIHLVGGRQMGAIG
jgi:histidine triad (HIT) family protein